MYNPYADRQQKIAIILGVGSVNESQNYIVTLSLTGWSHAQNKHRKICDTYWHILSTYHLMECNLFMISIYI